ncbi:MAG TPA: hypothetical protein VK364_11835 [Hymenobacter sp.]|nr:hypothetical protein [Hymenobacter sp.]
MQSNDIRLAPFGQAGADEFGSVVGAYLRRSAVALNQPGQYLHDPGSGQGKVNFDTQELSVVIVEHVKGAITRH